MPDHRKIVKPQACFTYSNVASSLHYNIRYFCQRAGYYYCADHEHRGNCCRPLSYEFYNENDQAAAALDKVMPRCGLCGERYAAIARITHVRGCLQKYIEKRKTSARIEMDRLIQEQSQDIFVPKENLTYNMVSEISLRSKYSASGKVLREVKFEEGR